MLCENCECYRTVLVDSGPGYKYFERECKHEKEPTEDEDGCEVCEEYDDRDYRRE